MIMCPLHGTGWCTCIGDSFFASIGRSVYLLAGWLGMVAIAVLVLAAIFTGGFQRQNTTDPHRTCIAGQAQYPGGPAAPSGWSDGSGDC